MMKKVYSAPDILFESFSLSTNIAGDCEEIIDNVARGNCAYHTRTGHNVFTPQLIGICTTTYDDGEYNNLCYHVPISDANLFNS